MLYSTELSKMQTQIM